MNDLRYADTILIGGVGGTLVAHVRLICRGPRKPIANVVRHFLPMWAYRRPRPTPVRAAPIFHSRKLITWSKKTVHLAGRRLGHNAEAS